MKSVAVFLLCVFILALYGSPLCQAADWRNEWNEWIDKCATLYKVSDRYCLAVDVLIIPGSNGSDYGYGRYTLRNQGDFFVGDYFYFEILLRNIGKGLVNETLNVSIYSPDRELIGSYSDKVELAQGQTFSLIPWADKNTTTHRIFDFDTAGSYKINVTRKTSDPILYFYRFYEPDMACVIRPNVFAYYFDVMPGWEKHWRDRLVQWQEISGTVTKETLKISILLYRVTYIVGFVTICQLAIAAWSARKRKLDAVIVVLVTTVLFLFAMIYLEVPWM